MQFIMPMDAGFDEEAWTAIALGYLRSWTNISFTYTEEYDPELVKFYDGFFGYLLKRTEKLIEFGHEVDKYDNIDAWKYQGKLYRVMHPYVVIDSNDEEQKIMPEVNYHGMITHWTTDYTFSGLMYKLSHNEEYIILEADTGKHFGFDVNKFQATYNCENRYTKKEQEVIFPMYKECIKEYRMKIADFIRMKES